MGGGGEKRGPIRKMDDQPLTFPGSSGSSLPLLLLSSTLLPPASAPVFHPLFLPSCRLRTTTLVSFFVQRHYG